MKDFSFKSGERLKSRKVIGQLFEEGHSFGQYPLRLVWLEVNPPRSDFPAQLSISVPKRRFRHAVVRNQLKRKVREAYRLRKHRLYQKFGDQDNQVALMVIYTGKEALPYQEIEIAMDRLLGRFIKTRKIQQRQTNQK
ncbi:MAG: ribonuclease P protein component [Saprospiraceae bacterium]|nr:MAG: ribonuclease P protein component [Saprospiraceae bacterium]